MVEFYLKILSGNHIGAEIPLEPGRYSLGRDENCDLVLTDSVLNDIELIVEISDDGRLGVQSHSEEGLLYLNGQPVAPGIQCQHFDILTSSGLFFTLGPVDAEWPELPLPELQYPEPAAERPDEDTEGENLPDPDGFSADTNSSEVPSQEDNEDEDYEDEYEEDEESTFRLFDNVNKKFLIAIPGALVLIAIIVLLVSVTSDDNPPPLTYLEQAQIVKQQMNLKDVTFSELPDNSLLLNGYTQTNKRKRDLQKQLRKRGIPFNSQIIAMNELRSHAEDFLKSRGYKDLLLELDNTPGTLIMTGYLPTIKELEELTASMKQEIHGLNEVVGQVENQTSRVNILKSMIQERQLSTRVNITVRAGKVIVQGRLLDETQTYSLQELVQRFRDRYGNHPQLALTGRTIAGTSPSGKPLTKGNGKVVVPSLSIRGISMGRVPYVVMEDGSKYLVGAKLANGYIIEDISLEYLLLSNGIDRIKYRLGGNRGGQ